MLQEISQQQAVELHSKLKSYPHVYADGAALTDTVLFARWPLRETGTVKLSTNGVSVLRAVVEWREKPITVVGAHLHWPIGARNSARRNGELVGLAALVRTHSEPVLLLGDFNITPWSAHFRALLEASELKDCAAGHGLDPTWPSQVWPLGIRIDHCFASAHWLTLDTWIGRHIGSDHRPMFAELVLR
jgi:endonuclease/exonuclease/phosphatase (EEP) superfamily protein YafD